MSHAPRPELSAANLAQWTAGTWNVPPTFHITSVTQDSRKVRLGSLY